MADKEENRNTEQKVCIRQQGLLLFFPLQALHFITWQRFNIFTIIVPYLFEENNLEQKLAIILVCFEGTRNAHLLACQE